MVVSCCLSPVAQPGPYDVMQFRHRHTVKYCFQTASVVFPLSSHKHFALHVVGGQQGMQASQSVFLDTEDGKILELHASCDHLVGTGTDPRTSFKVSPPLGSDLTSTACVPTSAVLWPRSHAGARRRVRRGDPCGGALPAGRFLPPRPCILHSAPCFALVSRIVGVFLVVFSFRES